MQMRLCNVERAQELMARDGVDGLVAANPLNQYYLSNYWGLFNTAGGYNGSYISLLPAQETEAASLILPALELRRLETTSGTWMPNLFTYFTESESAIERFQDNTPKGQEYRGWRPADNVAEGHLTELENRWMAIVDKFGKQASPDAFWALTRAIKNAELTRATLAVDDLQLIEWLSDCGLDNVRLLYRPQLFSEIRMVKTADELELMRKAASVNEHALLKAASSMQVGSTWNQVESVYMMDIASNGGRGVYVMCGLGELPAGSVRAGEPIFLDALGKYQHYHGDFGRCVVVGEPTKKHQDYHQAICAGWDAARALLKPGASTTEVSQKVAQVVRKAGIRGFRAPIVHSVGLEHTDEPKPYGVMPQTKGDQILQQNMVVNVDLPHTEIGWGSVHIEDTIVITADGFERLTKAPLDIIVNE